MITPNKASRHESWRAADPPEQTFPSPRHLPEDDPTCEHSPTKCVIMPDLDLDHCRDDVILCRVSLFSTDGV